MQVTWSIRKTHGISHKPAWQIIKIVDGRELATFMVYGRKKHALQKAADLNQSN
jgi:hypothetical protein